MKKEALNAAAKKVLTGLAGTGLAAAGAAAGHSAGKKKGKKEMAGKFMAYNAKENNYIANKAYRMGMRAGQGNPQKSISSGPMTGYKKTAGLELSEDQMKTAGAKMDAIRAAAGKAKGAVKRVAEKASSTMRENPFLTGAGLGALAHRGYTKQVEDLENKMGKTAGAKVDAIKSMAGKAVNAVKGLASKSVSGMAKRTKGKNMLKTIGLGGTAAAAGYGIGKNK